MRLKIGDTIPDFTLKDQSGNDFHSLSLLGKQPLVLFFYPKDFTPGCTKEVCNFRDHYESFVDLGAHVVGISSDSQQSHHRFSQKYSLSFQLLADKGGKVRKLFGVPGAVLGLLPGRETYVFDKDGKVIMLFNSIRADKHVDKALKALSKLKEA